MLGLDKDRIILDAIDAGHGDAFLLRYYDDDNEVPRLLLVDGGPTSASDPRDNVNAHDGPPPPAHGPRFVPYEKTLVPWLSKVRSQLAADHRLGGRANETKTVLDLVVCTHIDDDHIAGIDRLYDCLANNSKCAPGGRDIEAKCLWFNSFSAMLADVDINDAVMDEGVIKVLGVGQGETLTGNATKHGAAINPDAEGRLIVAGQHWKTRFRPADILITNPGRKSLENLAKDWKKKAPSIKQAIQQSLARNDTSVPNLSSIVMAVHWNKRSILMTGDQLGKDILKSLKALKYPMKDGVYHFDIVKVPHHGSVANVQKQFVDTVHADVYVFSANGKDMNPDPPVLDYFGQAAQAGRKFTMVFTNGNLSFQVTKKQKTPKIGGMEVRTLDEALQALAQTYPAFVHNVTILKRNPNDAAVSIGMTKTGPIQFSGHFVHAIAQP